MPGRRPRPQRRVPRARALCHLSARRAQTQALSRPVGCPTTPVTMAPSGTGVSPTVRSSSILNVFIVLNGRGGLGLHRGSASGTQRRPRPAGTGPFLPPGLRPRPRSSPLPTQQGAGAPLPRRPADGTRSPTSCRAVRSLVKSCRLRRLSSGSLRAPRGRRPHRLLGSRA